MYTTAQHTRWKIIDASDVAADKDLWDEMEALDLRNFPIIQIHGKSLRFQPTSVEEIARYIGQKQLQSSL
jgi:hypothetical protein